MTDFETIGKYEILEKIGLGGFAAVYKGRDPFIKRLVAIKICLSEDEALRRRFLREAEIAGNLHHRNIVTVFDFGFAPAGPYLVQEYLSGEDLKQKICRCQPIAEGRKLDYLRQIALGLEYAHAQGVLHRDVKPGNVRVLESHRIKLLDFGIAKLSTADTKLTEQGSILGTAGYLSPEQLLGRPVDARTDVFSFGALAYELLTYQRPFGGATLTEMLRQVLHGDPPPIEARWPECPPEMKALITRCLDKDPDRRYPGFSEVLVELTPLLARARSADRARAAAAAPPPAPMPPRAAEDGGSTRSFEDTRPVPAAEVDAALASPGPPVAVADPTAPGLRERQEVDSTLMTQARQAAPGDARRQRAGRGGLARLAARLAGGAAGLSVRGRRLAGGLAAALRRATAAARKVRSERRERGVADAEAGRPWAGEAPSALPSTAPASPPPTAGAIPAPAPSVPSAAIAQPAARWEGRRATLRRWLLWAAASAVGIAVLAVGGFALVHWTGERGAAPAETVTVPPEAPPPPPPQGLLVIDAAPWGEVVRVADAFGVEVELPLDRTTPLVLPLAAGTYRVEVARADAPAPGGCEVEVTAAATARCRVELYRVAAGDYFREAGWWR